MSDKRITCLQCGKDFDFTVGEQEWFAERNLHEPKYCKDCRRIRKENKEKQNQSKNFSYRQDNSQKAA